MCIFLFLEIALNDVCKQFDFVIRDVVTYRFISLDCNVCDVITLSAHVLF